MAPPFLFAFVSFNLRSRTKNGTCWSMTSCKLMSLTLSKALLPPTDFSRQPNAVVGTPVTHGQDVPGHPVLSVKGPLELIHLVSHEVLAVLLVWFACDSVLRTSRRYTSHGVVHILGVSTSTRRCPQQRSRSPTSWWDPCVPFALFPPEGRPRTKSRRQWRELLTPPHSASNHVPMKRPEYFETKASAMVARDRVKLKGGRCAPCSEHNRLERPCNVEWSIVFCFTTRETAHTCQH